MFAVSVASVPLCHFGLACAILGVAVFLGLPVRFWVWLSLGFSGPTSRSGDIDHFNLEKHF